jgi:hypothetical protein
LKIWAESSDHDETVKGMRMFVREVYPRFKELRPGAGR